MKTDQNHQMKTEPQMAVQQRNLGGLHERSSAQSVHDVVGDRGAMLGGSARLPMSDHLPRPLEKPLQVWEPDLAGKNRMFGKRKLLRIMLKQFQQEV